MKNNLFLCLFSATLPVFGETATNLVIQVEANRLTASSRPGSQLLREVRGLSLREQGIGGAQSDLSIRGSAFNTTGLLLNGLTLRNAQTEHWHADMPVPDAWFETPQVLTGLDRFRLASGHPSGSIDLRLAPLLDDVRSVTLGGGDKELFFGNALFTETGALENGGRTAASGFASFDSDRQTDGYAGNNLLRMTAGGRAGAYGEKMEGDLIATGGWRDFGARGFYGAANKYPAEEEVTDYLVAGNLRGVEDPAAPAQLTAAWQRVHDLYWLDKHNHDFYENEHMSDQFSLHGNDRHIFNELFSLDTRADADLETIDSPSLGDHTREHSSLAALPNLTLGDWMFTAGGSWELFSAYSPQFCPAGGVSWEFVEGQTLQLNYTEANRQPSYTELNYESPDSLGNRGLSLQKTRTAEAAWKGERESSGWKLAGFYERGSSIVDWIRATPSSRWTSVNLDPIDSWGLTGDGHVRLSSGTELGGDGLLLTKDCDSDFYSSRYAMDYPDASCGISLRQDLNKAFSLFADRSVPGQTFNKGLSLKLREGAAHYAANPVRQHGDTRLTSDAELQWTIRNGLALNLGVVNIFDDDFQTFPGQEVCGRRFYASATFTW